MVLKETLLKNIDKFKSSDFCSEGGRPNFDGLEVLVFSEEKYEAYSIFDVGIIYHCEIAGCCFIPGGNDHAQLHKKIKVSDTHFEVLD